MDRKRRMIDARKQALHHILVANGLLLVLIVGKDRLDKQDNKQRQCRTPSVNTPAYRPSQKAEGQDSRCQRGIDIQYVCGQLCHCVQQLPRGKAGDERRKAGDRPMQAAEENERNNTAAQR